MRLRTPSAGSFTPSTSIGLTTVMFLQCSFAKKYSVRTETNQNNIFYGCVSVCFGEPKTKNVGLFRFILLFRTYIKTTKKRPVSNQTETTLNFLKNAQICSLSNCLDGLLFHKNYKFSEKVSKYAPYQTVAVGLCLFRMKHWNSLFGIETKQTKQMFCFR